MVAETCISHACIASLSFFLSSLLHTLQRVTGLASVAVGAGDRVQPKRRRKVETYRASHLCQSLLVSHGPYARISERATRLDALLAPFCARTGGGRPGLREIRQDQISSDSMIRLDYMRLVSCHT